MKTKLVLWTKDGEDAKVLVALQLKPTENNVCTWQVKGEAATDELYKQLMDEWREDKEVTFPDDTTYSEKELSAGGDLLPEGLEAEKKDILTRAQTEWLFIALSTKLHQSYANELEELKEKVNGLTNYSQEVWEELKGFWAKVREQMRDRNLFREHADQLKLGTNELFDKMKEHRSALDAEFREKAEENYSKLKDILDDIEERIKNNAAFHNIFEDLKNLQKQFRNTQLTKDLRQEVWNRIDNAFKVVKERRFGKGGQTDRLQRRYNGLMSAIKKMEHSIKRDEDEKEFQERKINSVYAQQLETQIRQAKIKMIEERIRSKQEKLKEMYATKIELEDKMEMAKKDAEAKAKKEAEAKAKKEAEAKAKKEAEAKAAAEKAESEEKVAAEKKKAETEEIVEKSEETTENVAVVQETSPAEATKTEETTSLEVTDEVNDSQKNDDTTEEVKE